MAEIDLEALIAKAEEVQDDKVVLARNWAGKYRVYLYDQPIDDYNRTYEECIKQIRAWGLPPKPKTLTFTLDTEYCEAVLSDIKAFGAYEFDHGGAFETALVAALAQYQQPE